MGKKLDLRRMQFGRLVVVEEVGRSKSRKVLWRCRCACGNETVVSSGELRSGNTTSCGCFHRECVSKIFTKHGLRRHPLYVVWQGLMERTGVVKGANDRVRRDYADRGISVCDAWRCFESFAEWSLSHGYEKGLQIDRIDNDGPYSPDNCRFVTPKQNSNNRRNTHRLSDGTPLAMLASSFGIETYRSGQTKEYTRIRYAFRNHGEQAAIQKVFDIALEQFADKHGFTYVENALAIIQ